ncbi:MAG: InlB B-repeat-containing protein, partial [Anaeroplasmataceae bacterium]|nr:InlB B-repeat-containing protein [Anaeroplasmataceae bacterium]
MKKRLLISFLCAAVLLSASTITLTSCFGGDDSDNSKIVDPVKEYFTVTIDLNDGTTPTVKQVEKGKKLTGVSEPTKEGYTFAGWKANGVAWTMDEVVTKNITIVAQWIENEEPVKEYCTITIDLNDGSTPKTQQVEKGKKALDIENPTRTDYIFAGWKANEMLWTTDQIITSNITIVAQWTPKQSVEPVTEYFTVTIDLNDDSTPTTKKVEKGQKLIGVSEPTRDGYTFDGWKANGVTWTMNTAITSNITIVAQWTPKQSVEPVTEYFTVTIDLNDGSTPTTKKVEKGQKLIEVSEPTRDGYTFTGWKANSSDWTMDTAITADITIVAQWEEIASTYTLTFNTQGGNSIEECVANAGSMINEPKKPKKSGYHFVCWSYTPDGSLEVTWPLVLDDDKTVYAIWNESINLKDVLVSLLGTKNYSPFSYIPESMYAENRIVSEQSLEFDLSTTTNLSNISYDGFGEQWNMINDNLIQSQRFYKLLTVVDVLSVSITTAFNNYIDSNPDDENSFDTQIGIYSVQILFEDGILSLNITYYADLPIFGNQEVKIKLTYEVLLGERTGRVQIGTANALKYKMVDDNYQFAIKYLGVRRAYFELDREADDVIKGSIFEFLVVAGKEIQSSAQFVINQKYVNCVGNKADGILGAKNYISEVYDVKTGSLLGYEVREVVKNVTFNTLWFRLDDVTGIQSIKVLDEDNELNSNSIYLNGSNEVFQTKKVGGINLKTASRRYDIELRT